MVETSDGESPLIAAIEEMADEIPPELAPLAKALEGDDRAALECAWEAAIAEILDES